MSVTSTKDYQIIPYFKGKDIVIEMYIDGIHVQTYEMAISEMTAEYVTYSMDEDAKEILGDEMVEDAYSLIDALEDAAQTVRAVVDVED